MGEFSVPGDKQLASQLEALARELTARDWKMAAAESCTGGWIAKCCTDLSGSSDWFDRGFVTYSNEAKIEMLGVKPATLEECGAVSRETALEMVKGALGRAGVEAAVAVTGIAGPGGGTADKPVGTVWFGWALAGQGAEAEKVRFDGGRDAVRRQTVYFALRGLLSRLGA